MNAAALKNKITIDEKEAEKLSSFLPFLGPSAAKALSDIRDRREVYLPDMVRLLRLLRDQLTEYIDAIEAMHGKVEQEEK